MFFRDTSQEKVKARIRTYLSAQGRDPALIQRFEEGYCSAMTTLALYGTWLETQQRPDPFVERDDWEWFNETLMGLTYYWDGNYNTLTVDAKKDIDRLINLLEYFQHIYLYRSVGQGELQLSLMDTKNRHLQKEYSLAGLFTANDFLKPINLNDRKTTLLAELIKEDRMVIVNSHNHETGIFMHKGTYYYYDANQPSGRQIFDEKKLPQLINDLFESFQFDPATPSPFGIRVFDFSPQPANYPRQSDLLSVVAPALVPAANNTNSTTSLHMAAHIGDSASVDYYLKQKIDVNATRTDGSTAILLAAYRGYADIVEKLIKQGADPNIPRDKTTGITPLFLAVQRGHENAVEKLAINGADVNQPIANGITPLMIAVQTGKVDTAAILLNHHADPDKRNPHTQYTPLLDAVITGNEAMTKLLLKNGAQVDLDINGITPLFAAAQNGQTGIAHLLLQKGAQAKTSITTKPEVLMDIPNKYVSVANVTDHMIKLCKAHHINHINTPIKDFSALHIAAFLGYADTVRELLKNGADPQAQTEYGISVRELAISPAIQQILDQAVALLASQSVAPNQRGR